MTANCTVLIPTHNRPRHLDRVIRWFSTFGCPIVVVDSSSSEWRSAVRDATPVTYIHRPGGFEVYVGKIAEALGRIETPLVAMCADDDFITREGLETSVSFLLQNADYSFSQGYAYQFQRFGRRLVVWPMVYPLHTLESANWIERVEKALSTVYYGVNRTSVLRSAFEFLARQNLAEVTDSMAGLLDMGITRFAARCGKFKRQEMPFGLREYSPYVSSVGKLTDMITSRNVPDFYANLLNLLADGDPDPEIARRLRRTFAADFAAQMAFDLSIQPSRKRMVSWLRPALRTEVEYAYRMAHAVRLYAKPEYRRFRAVFSCPDYSRFKAFVLKDTQS